MIERIKNEPALFLALVGQVIAVAVGFGVELTTNQVFLLEGLVAAAVSFGIRKRVTPVRKLETKETL